MRITRICLDMDGVLCDFVGPALGLFGKRFADVEKHWERGRYDLEHVLHVSSVRLWQVIDQAGADFWDSLPAFPWAELLLERCQRVAPTVIVTAPSGHEDSHVGKLRWLKRVYGSSFRDYFMGSCKHFCGGYGAALIDDSDANCEVFRAAGGQGIVFPAIWNSGHGVARLANDTLRFAYAMGELHRLRVQDHPGYRGETNRGGARKRA